MPDDVLEVDLAGILGAAEEASTQQLTLYIPDTEYDQREPSGKGT